MLLRTMKCRGLSLLSLSLSLSLDSLIPLEYCMSLTAFKLSEVS